MKITALKSLALGAALAVSVIPLGVSAKTTSLQAIGNVQLQIQPLGQAVLHDAQQTTEVARIRRSFRAGQRGGWRTLRNIHRRPNVVRSPSWNVNRNTRANRLRHRSRGNRNFHGNGRFR